MPSPVATICARAPGRPTVRPHREAPCLHARRVLLQRDRLVASRTRSRIVSGFTLGAFVALAALAPPALLAACGAASNSPAAFGNGDAGTTPAGTDASS